MPLPDSPAVDVQPPGRAPVVPRGRLLPDGEVLPIEDLIRPWIEAGAHGAIAIKGGPGSGRSVALAHLAAAFGEREGLVFLDEPTPPEVEARAERALVVFTALRPDRGWMATIVMAGWCDDDAIEYLLAVNRARCASVMTRLRADTERSSLLAGSPLLWRGVIDDMAADEALPGVASALKQRIDRLIPAWEERWRIGSVLLKRLNESSRGLVPGLVAGEADDLVQHRSVRLLLAAESIAADLRWGVFHKALESPLPRELLKRVAHLARPDAAVRDALVTLLASGEADAHPMAASLLLAIDPDWRPAEGSLPMMTSAILPGVRWSGLNLKGVRLHRADLQGAHLTRADLAEALLAGANLTDALLSRANLESADAREADFTDACLYGARLGGANMRSCTFHGADLREARLAETKLTNSTFDDANLAGAILIEADLGHARFHRANLTGADLSHATADGVDFKAAFLDGALFLKAKLFHCDFEGVTLEAPYFRGANLSGAYLTDSRMPRANFHEAILYEAGLSGIEWEGADLRDADFTHASFHLGSSRSGLVGSTIASEGSRTGFYTDEFHEQEFKSPEEIRKANLRGADLRGAKVMYCDFYLVDLRGALYTPDQGEHFARCRAILHDRAE